MKLNLNIVFICRSHNDNLIDLIKNEFQVLILSQKKTKKVDFVFLDGGHAYETVKNDLECCLKVVQSNGTIMCDDYNFGHLPDVKKAIDEFVKNNKLKCKILFDGRFAKIEK